MKLLGANPDAKVTGLEELPGKSNYFLGNDPKKWRTNVPHFARVRFEDVYPGIDLVYYGTEQGQLEYDFIVHPGADPAIIRQSTADHTRIVEAISGRDPAAAAAAMRDHLAHIEESTRRFAALGQPSPPEATG